MKVKGKVEILQYEGKDHDDDNDDDDEFSRPLQILQIGLSTTLTFPPDSKICEGKRKGEKERKKEKGDEEGGQNGKACYILYCG